MKVGILVTVALILMAALVLQQSWGVAWFTPSERVITYLPDVGGLKPGAPVWLAGIEIGKVRKVTIVPPAFSMTSAARDTHAYGLNKVGLERRGFSKERIRKIQHAYKVLLASKMNTSQALEKLKSEADRGEDVQMLIRFIESSERGVIK